VFLRAQVCDRRGRIRARSGGITRDVLLRSVGEHLVLLLAPATQCGCLLHLLAILIRITCESRLLSTWLWGNTRLVLILGSCHRYPSRLLVRFLPNDHFKVIGVISVVMMTMITTAPKIADAPFHRYVSRALLGIALIGLWPLVKNLGFKSLSDVGLVRPRGQWKKLGGGFLLGFVSLAILVAIAFACHAREVNSRISSGKIAENLLSAAATAIVVATLE